MIGHLDIHHCGGAGLGKGDDRLNSLTNITLGWGEGGVFPEKKQRWIDRQVNNISLQNDRYVTKGIFAHYIITYVGKNP